MSLFFLHQIQILPLIPQGSNLVTTLMFEIADENLRHEFLSSIGNVEEYISMEVANDKIKARFESDVERTNSKGKTSFYKILDLFFFVFLFHHIYHLGEYHRHLFLSSFAHFFFI